MILASATVMALRLRRDIPTLLLAFALPPLVFLVFAAVFHEAATRPPTVSVAVVEVSGTSGGRDLAAALARGGLRVLPPSPTALELRDRVAAGAVDVGVVGREGTSGPFGEPELIVLDGHGVAADLVRARLADRPVRTGPADEAIPDPGGPTIVDPSHGDPVVLREVGPVAAIFLMLAAIQTAMSLVDEQASGIHERLASNGDVSGLVVGKLAFGALVGTLQAALILLTAAASSGGHPPAHPAWAAVTCVLAAAMATSLTLLVSAACSTRQQVQTISTFAILVASAVGGSMVPSALMPAGLARVGRLTPNAWIIDAFDAALGLGDLGSHPPLSSWAAMAGLATAATSAATWAIRRPSVL